jgi:protein FAM32A
MQEEQQMRQNVKTGYRQKVDKFNSYLESLSEHHDIPKVGNAGMG